MSEPSANLTFGGTVTLQGNGRANVEANSLTFSGVVGSAAPNGMLTKDGVGALALAGSSANTYAGPTIVNGGTLMLAKSANVVALQGAVTVNNGATLRLQNHGQFGANTAITINQGTFDHQGFAADFSSLTLGNTTLAVNGGNLIGDVNGGGTSVITTTGNATLGRATSFTGFRTQGAVNVGAGQSLTLASAAFAQLNGVTTLSGGSITAANGVSLGAGAVLTGAGAVNAKVAGSAGSIINGTGNLSLGANTFGGFVHHGELRTGINSVTLNSLNQATLGSVTTLGAGGTAGTLNVATGAFVDFGRVIAGYGTVVSSNSATTPVVINGAAVGDSATNRLTFDGYVKGVGTFDNVTFNGTFAPGLSPAIVNTQNATLGANSVLEIEIGGTTPGSGHDKLVESGTLSLGGTLKVLFINGYAPSPGHFFDVLDWGSLSGTFANMDFSNAPAPAGYSWDATAFYSSGVLSFSQVPEPSSLALMGAAGAALWIGRRKKRRVAFVRCNV